MIEEQVPRSWYQRVFRQLLLACLPYPQRFKHLLQAGRVLRPLLPVKLKNKLPSSRPIPNWPSSSHPRRVLLLEGCVQRSLAAHIDACAAQVLDHLGISAIRQATAGCCGALAYHLGDHAAGLDFMRRLIDMCWPVIESGVEAIVMTASGCGVMLKDYGHLLRHDPVYADKAARFSSQVQDLSELLSREDLGKLKPPLRKLAFQAPCTLQHGQKLGGVVEGLLQQLGFELTPVVDAHLCCGSAGTYSLLQSQIAGQLRQQKLQHLQQGQPDMIATANIGCWLHLQEIAEVPVLHWIELLLNRET